MRYWRKKAVMLEPTILKRVKRSGNDSGSFYIIKGYYR